MRNILTKIALAATFGLAITFTLGCPNTGSGDEPSSSSADNPSSSSGIAPSSSGTKPSSSSGIAPSSSSGTPPSSSSSLPLSSSQAQAIVPVHGDPITDSRDGKTYETVVIGTQTWMAKNLDYETETGSKCYNDNALNCQLYGRLYNWETAMTACQAGWHLPSDFEWVVLEDFIGGTEKAAWKKLRATSYSSGTDDYGFSALPSGYCLYDHFYSGDGRFWASTKSGTNSAYCREYNINDVFAYYYNNSVDTYYSVRCLKGDKYIPPSSPSYTPVSCQNIPEKGGFCDDRDGKGYKSVTIDGKTWMAENLAFNAKGSVCYAEGLSGVSADSIAKNCTTYGRLYDWSTAMAFEPTCQRAADCKSWIAEKHKGNCPSGWHIPSDAEWTELVTFAGGSSTAGQILKATSGWTSGNGADLLGFSALPGGSGYSGGSFSSVGYYGYWWSATEYDAILASSAYYRSMVSYDNNTKSNYDSKGTMRSLRCVKD